MFITTRGKNGVLDTLHARTSDGCVTRALTAHLCTYTRSVLLCMFGTLGSKRGLENMLEATARPPVCKEECTAAARTKGPTSPRQVDSQF
ncbi:uncharacterized protein PHALS_12315 [Plasmopara halstedii]|uniref:Uncharacterized protein n=1 Tax=Plasmopara halstedii TaxID=4781 RepID=A0A0P1AMJ6_PLAHL|nr:uncharacterized protein PHALS_12315 [Plasmopara halstedii]CEG42008.1 hypothetical protein PHALS_12315 [Plasmopara halstedii]|eukprot:XP_024578377.1 hypothetical protein PHALS_12315 [Plasmopara halstedii]